jgi:hypothetical protein
MKRLLMVLVALGLGGCFATTRDGRVVHSVGFSLRFPEVLPPLVVVRPGVSVVRDYDDEVFYSDGYYWARQDQGWYRTRDHRGSWAQVEERQVPEIIVRSPPGRYRHYRGE